MSRSKGPVEKGIQRIQLWFESRVFPMVSCLNTRSLVCGTDLKAMGNLRWSLAVKRKAVFEGCTCFWFQSQALCHGFPGRRDTATCSHCHESWRAFPTGMDWIPLRPWDKVPLGHFCWASQSHQCRFQEKTLPAKGWARTFLILIA